MSAATSRGSTEPAASLADRSLAALREEYRFWLFEDFLPFLGRYVVDHELGGFMCETDRDGTNLSGNKRTWYEGRGIWVYSFLYGEIRPDPAYLEIARKSVELILPHDPAGPDLLPVGFHRDGTPLERRPDDAIYGDMFVATGLQEFARASGDTSYWEMAKAMVLKCAAIYEHRAGYQSLPPTDGAPAVERPRILGHWFVLLHCTTQMLAKRDDREMRALNARCIDAILNRHLDPETGLLSEYLHADCGRIDSPYGQVVTGHAVEASWMLLYEAARRGDDALFERAAALLRRHIEALWDDVYGGLFLAFHDVSQHRFDLRKALWLQEEALIGTLLVYERTGALWAAEWFSRIYTYVVEKFPLAPHGYPLWILYADRQVTFEPRARRVGNFHHPRHLMLNLLALDRLIARL